MSESDSVANPRYWFENDLTGRLFCWLIESGKIDYTALIEQALRDDADQGKAVKRLAKDLDWAVSRSVEWAANCRSPGRSERPDPNRPKKAPGYGLWFRPCPSKKIKFKEVAEALLVFTGRLPPGSPE